MQHFLHIGHSILNCCYTCIPVGRVMVKHKAWILTYGLKRTAMPNELKYHKASHTVHSSTYCTDPFYHKSRVVKETRGNCNALNVIGIYYFALYYYNTTSIGFFFFFWCPICNMDFISRLLVINYKTWIIDANSVAGNYYTRFHHG